MGEIFTAFAALIFVIGLLGLFAWAVKRFGFIPGQGALKPGKKHINILESKMLDGRNRLVTVSWKGKEYLLSTNPAGVKLIDSVSGDQSSDQSELTGENENT